ncbi:MAG: DoxX family protein, partial [Micropepsaceae bacterium]
MTSWLELFRTVMRYVLAAAYLFVGVVHLRSPDVFLPIVPDWVPFPRETVLLTGACEIAGAVALLTQRLRYAAGVMLALYAICVFPANVKHAMEDVALGGTRL